MCKNSDNNYIRQQCIISQDFDIIGLAEIYLINGRNIEISGYMWFGQNRKHIHIRAKKESGGVGFLVKQSIYESYDISIIDNEHEGILWLKFSPTFEGTGFC